MQSRRRMQEVANGTKPRKGNGRYAHTSKGLLNHLSDTVRDSDPQTKLQLPPQWDSVWEIKIPRLNILERNLTPRHKYKIQGFLAET